MGGRDRLILSKAHGSPGLYAALALRGFFPLDDVYTYCELGGRLEGHTDMLRTPGLESSGGPLGMGLSVSVGRALGLRYKRDPRARVFCILGDGESNEGNVWEAAMAAAHYQLDNLIAVVDYNKVMAKGFTHDQMGIEPFADKWRAFGWEVIEVDGHDIDELADAFHRARRILPHGQPIVVIAHTVKGNGVDIAEFNPKWHTHAPDRPRLTRCSGSWREHTATPRRATPASTTRYEGDLLWRRVTDPRPPEMRDAFANALVELGRSGRRSSCSMPISIRLPRPSGSWTPIRRASSR